MSAAFHVRQSAKRKSNHCVSRCKCGRHARPNQRNCDKCHAAAQVRYRARRKDQAHKLELQLNRFVKIINRMEQNQ